MLRIITKLEDDYIEWYYIGLSKPAKYLVGYEYFKYDGNKNHKLSILFFAIKFGFDWLHL